MRASELIDWLVSAKANYGDLEVLMEPIDDECYSVSQVCHEEILETGDTHILLCHDRLQPVLTLVK